MKKVAQKMTKAAEAAVTRSCRHVPEWTPCPMFYGIEEIDIWCDACREALIITIAARGKVKRPRGKKAR